MHETDFRELEAERQADVDALRQLFDLMGSFTDNDQRARFLLSSNWLRDHGAAAAARAQADHANAVRRCNQ